MKRVSVSKDGFRTGFAEGLDPIPDRWPLPDRLTRSVLLGIDGEPHTVRAIRWAAKFTASNAVRLIALHVVDLDPLMSALHDPSLDRKLYLLEVNDTIKEKSEPVVAEFERLAREAGLSGGEGHNPLQAGEFGVKVRPGDVFREMLLEMRRGKYDLLVLGRKQVPRDEKLKSRYLPYRLKESLHRGLVVVVPGVEEG
jgi:nucleotide-binding universal stress UspA family protein